MRTGQPIAYVMRRRIPYLFLYIFSRYAPKNGSASATYFERMAYIEQRFYEYVLLYLLVNVYSFPHKILGCIIWPEPYAVLHGPLRTLLQNEDL